MAEHQREENTSIRTRTELGAKLFEVTLFASAVVFIAALSLIFSIVFAPAGIVAFGLAIGILLLGLAAAIVVPYVPLYRRMQCPACGEISQVFPGVWEFECERCGTALRVPAGVPGVYPFADTAPPREAAKPGEMRPAPR